MPHFSSNPHKPDNPPEISFVPPGKSSVSHSGKPHAAANADSYLTYLCRNERLSDAVNALDSLAQAKVKTATLIELLQSCIDSKSLDLGRKIHARIDLAEDQSVFVWTKLVGMYAKCGSFVDARKVFDGMRERNLYTWSAIIAACCRENRWEEAMDLFYSMMRDGILPDGFLLPKILQACANCEDYETGRLIHSLVIKCGHGSYPLVNNSILSMYAKCGKLELALLLFHCIDKTNIVAWNTLMNGYCLKGEIDEAVHLFNAMCKEGVAPNSLTWTILLTGYHNIGHCDAALDIMKTMESFGIKTDVVAWTSVISGYAQSNGQQSRAISLFKEMISAGAQPNEVTIAVVISVCAYMRWLNNGLEIHAFAVKMGFIDDNVFVGNSFIDFYSKCEKLDAAQEVFDMMPEKNALTWNSMIGGYIEAGYWRKAYDLFTRMQKSDIQPNVVTWNTLISGLMQNGDEEEAIDMFYRMEKDAKTKCDIVTWNALIAGYSKMGQKEKAVRVFRQMLSYGFSPNTVSILSVLPAVANLITLQNVKELHGAVLRRNLEASISISNSLIDSYANSGKLEYSRTLFEKMKRKDPITWDSMTAAYIAHGCSDTALTLVDDMLAQGLPPNQGTFVNMILAHSLNGNVDGGPWGGDGGKKWDDGLYSGVRQLLIAHGSGVDSLQFEYDNKGASIWSHKHGGTGGTKTDKVKLDYPNEYLTSINGYYGSLYDWGPVMIRSLTFETNKAKYGPYGDEQGTYFSLRTQGGKIIGFHGRGDWYLDAIGIKYQKSLQQNHKAASPPSNALVGAATDNHGYSVIQGSAGNNYDIVVAVRQKNHEPFVQNNTNNHAIHSKVSPPKQSTLPLEHNKGPSTLDKPVWGSRHGGTGGFKTDKGVFSGIQQIFLTRTVDAICSIQIEYDRSGQSVWSVKHGSNTGTSTHRVKLEYPHETLVSISGYYGPTNREDKLKVVRSLSFQTTRGKLGPFGEEVGTFFTSSTAEGKVVGFHGRSGAYLDAIGLHMQYWLGSSNKPTKTSLFRRYG
ncbi:Pentatricopeptide repeat-containing protein At1g19720 [Linum perenne]